MRFYLATIKCFVLAFNLICLIFAIGAISFAVLGLQDTKFGTDEHAYFIVGIILGCLVAITTFFGCYGVVCELLGVNVVYGLLLLILIAVQYLQLSNFQPHNFYRHHLQHVELAWQQMQQQPQLMAAIEQNFHCCALDSYVDYENKHLSIPSSCYHHNFQQTQQNQQQTAPNIYSMGCRQTLEISYQFAIRREKLYSWCMMIAECVSFAYAAIFAAMLYFQQRRPHVQLAHNFVDRYANHAGSRTILIPQ